MLLGQFQTLVDTENISHNGTTGGDATLDRSYDYDHVGRLQYTHTGLEARQVTGEPTAGVGYGPYSQHVFYDVWGNITGRQGWGGWHGTDSATFTNNRRDGLQYDASGNLTFDGGQTFQYDATGQQVSSQWVVNMQHAYDGDGLRVRKTQDGVTTYALRSTVLGGQVVAELQYWNGSWNWVRGYMYLGGQLPHSVIGRNDCFVSGVIVIVRQHFADCSAGL